MVTREAERKRERVKMLNTSPQWRPAGIRGNYRIFTLLFYMCVIAHLHKQEMRRAEDTTAIMASEMSVWRRGNAHT